MAGGRAPRQQPPAWRPSQTTVVVVSDIVGSTALRSRVGEAAFTEVREAHDAAASDLVEACRGRVVRFLGDGLLVAFASAGDALEYASMLQTTVDRATGASTSLDLRVGISLGDAIDVGGDLDGPALVKAARLCDAAQPRQILCTALVVMASSVHASDDFGPPLLLELKGLGEVEVREFRKRVTSITSAGLALSVLGPIRATRSGRELALGGLKEQRVLAVLAAAAGTSVNVDELVEALWNDDPPRTAERSVHAYIARLRRALEPSRDRGAPPRVIVTEGRGYRLVVNDDALDSISFEHLTTSAHDDLVAGHALRARRSLDDALAQWRGTPFDQHHDAMRCAQESRRLEEVRALAVEDLVSARLELGEARALVPELETLVAQSPWRERSWAHLAVALYRAGRQADALAALQRARTALREELGIEPGPELRHLEAAILEHDPALMTSSPGVSAPARRLPPALDPGGAVLVGRTEELALLRAAWERAFAGRGEFVAVVGIDGVGKTRLVAEVAAQAYESGALVLHARCDAADRGPEALLDRALRGAGAELSDTVHESDRTPGAGLARFLTSWSAGRPVLLALDDLHLADTATVEALADLAEWSGSAPLLVVATFRSEGDDGDTGPGRVVLRPLPRDEVHEIAAIYRPHWDEDEIDELVRATGGIPLSVHHVASEWAQTTTRQEVHAAAERATEARVRLSATRGDLADGIEGLQRLIEQRQIQLASATASVVSSTVPYRGLEAFDVESADLFFGRDQLLAELVARVASAPLVVVVGASGSGKSSLVQAGLLPALESGVLWDPVSSTTTTVTPASGIDALRGASERAAPERRVVVVDPLEELWTTQADADTRRVFCDELVLMARDEDVALVVCVRADFVGRVAEHAELAALVGANTLLVPPMTSSELRQVVEGPARRAGLTVEPQLVEAVLADVQGRPGALPLLSTALLATWEGREGRAMTLAAYRRAGGVTSAMAAMADATYASLSAEAQHAARPILLHLAGEEHGVDVRRRVSVASLGIDDDPAAKEAFDALVARRLVIVDHDVAEVAHEALLRDWPRLSEWLDEDRTGRRLHQQLAVAATSWDDAQRDESELYRGTRLQSALDWAGDHREDLAPIERQFLDDSARAAAQELDDARTRARTESRRSRRLRVLLVGIVVLLVVALVAGGLALRSRNAADATALRADANRLAALGSTGPALERSVLDAAEGVQLHDSADTRAGLLAALQRAPRALRVTRMRGASGLHLAPDGKSLVVELGGTRPPQGAFVGDEGRIVRADDLTTVRAYRSLPASAIDSGRLATTWLSNDLEPGWQFHPVVRSAGGRGDAQRFGSARGIPNRLLADARSNTLVAAGAYPDEVNAMFIASWDLATPGSPPRAQIVIPWTSGWFPSLMPAPNGTMLYLVRQDRIAVLDASTLAEVRSLPSSPGGTPRGADLGALSTDGTRIATLDSAGQILVRNTTTGDLVSTVPRQPATVSALEFDPSGRRLAVGREDGQIGVWDLVSSSGSLLGVALAGQRSETMAMQFSADGRDLWSASLDGTIVRWDVDGSRSLYPRVDTATPRNPSSGAPEGIQDYRFTLMSLDGRRVLYAFANGLHERDLATGVVDTQVDYEALEPAGAITSPDGRQLYVMSDGRILRFAVGTRSAAAVSEPIRASIQMSVTDEGRLVLLTPTGLAQLDGETLDPTDPEIPVENSGNFALDPKHQIAAVLRFDDDGARVTFVDLRRARTVGSVRIPVPAGIGLSFQFAPGGRMLAVGYPGGRVRLVDRRTLRVTLTSDAVVDGNVQDLLFTRDYLVVAASDGTFGLLDPDTLVVRARIRPVPETTPSGSPLLQPNSFALATQDGRAIVIGVGEAVTSFDPRVESLLDRACRLAGPDLPAAHWREVLPDRDRVPPCH